MGSYFFGNTKKDGYHWHGHAHMCYIVCVIINRNEG